MTATTPPPATVMALLTNAAGQCLLVRGKDSLLWDLPGGLARYPAKPLEMLAVLCRRQVGVIPDFGASVCELHFAGKSCLVAWDEIPRDAPRAGRTLAATAWFRPEALPKDITPFARYAITSHFEGQSVAHVDCCVAA